MGGKRAARSSWVSGGAFGTALVVVCTLALLAACGDEPSEPGRVSAAAAYTAIVQWQAGEQEPVVDDKGDEQLPVIYIVADSDGTIDVGVQADVAEATVDMATVRFADESGDAFDTDVDAGTDAHAVKDQGSLLVVDSIPPPAPTIDVDVVRYLAAEEPEPFLLEISADDPDEPTGDGDTASVTSVTQP